MASIAKIQHFDGECKKIAKFNGVVAFHVLLLVLRAFSRLANTSPAPLVLHQLDILPYDIQV